ncbi:signal transduction histidine kinase [Cupriavidus sp. HMR-1]|uniref:CHASE3 domain-containing protein n=1 Tax=Cupriavidus TaxID=106589 RepID=UPI0002A1CF8C|nr:MULTISPECIES: CHASE3 domain-containing protein [Cupriavidus]EKZ99487.1 signal transduction histidine kinase [Cupriavidus sp. HMR-1]
MAKHSLLVRNTLLLVSGIMLTLAVLIASETGNQRLREGYTEAIRSQQLQNDLGDLIGELVNAEGGQRGFLLTGKDSYLDPYYKALPRINELMSRIRQHYADDPEGLRQFGEASQFVTRKLNEMALTLVYGKRDFDVALDMVRTDFGKQTMENARRGLEHLQVRESGTVTHNLEAAEHDLQLSRYGIGLLTAINIALMVTLGMGHARRMAMADATRAELEEESARLDRKVRARTRQLSALAAHLQRVTEDEKTRLARELHDELGAILTAIKLDLHWVRMRVQDTHPEARDKLTRVMQHADQAIQIKRQLIEDLRPTVLLNLGLREAIVQLVEDVGTRNQWDTALDLPETLPRLNDPAAIALYRIVQESLTNASKYAEAKQVSVTLACTTEHLVLTVRDDGRGLPPDFDAGSIAGHHGLLGMEQRVLALGGTMQVDSSPGHGVTIRIEVPLTAAVLAQEEPAE